jgi:hypothetical protein
MTRATKQQIADLVDAGEELKSQIQGVADDLRASDWQLDDATSDELANLMAIVMRWDQAVAAMGVDR